MRFARYALSIFLLAAGAAAEEAPVPSYTCHRARSAIFIDGKLDDAAWKLAPRVDLVNAENGKPVGAHAESALLWDEQYLYVLFDVEDRDIWGTMTKRDDPVYTEEVVEVFLDPDGDCADYYEVNVSPRNTIFDYRVWNPTGRQPDLDAVGKAWTAVGMKTGVRVSGTIDNRNDLDSGWTVEMAIPYTPLRARPRVGDIWRFNLYRINLTPETEFQAWSPTMTSPPAFHIPARFGKLIFKE